MPHTRPRKVPIWPLAVSFDLAAAMLDCRVKTLKDAAAAKKLRIYRDPTSTRVRIKLSDLEKYLDREWESNQ
jgi:hypothetical protein